MIRTELVANAKRRARQYVGEGDYRSAAAIMLIDLTQFAMYAAAHREETEVIRFIEGFPED